MIARRWQGVVPKSKSDDYLEYLKKTGVGDCQKIDGNRGALLLRRNEKDKTHYLLFTLWDSFDAIREFVGENTEKALYYPEDKDYLLELEPNVIHYEVVADHHR